MSEMFSDVPLRPGIAPELPPDIGHDVLLTPFPFFLGCQGDHEDCPVDLLQTAVTQHVVHPYHFGYFLDDLFRLRKHLVRFIDGIVDRRFESHEKLALVFLGDEFLADESRHGEAQEKYHHGQHENRLPPVEAVDKDPPVNVFRLFIIALQPVPRPVEPGHPSRPVRMSGVIRLVGFQEPRGEHGGQGEGNQQGDEDGEDDGEGELQEEPTDDPLHEGNGKEDGHDSHGRRHDGKPDLRRGKRGCLTGFHPLFDMAIDVLDDDDGVVDEKTDRTASGPAWSCC